MRIGYITQHDPFDVASWSGTVWGMSEGIVHAGGDLVRLGPLETRVSPRVRVRQIQNRLRRRRHFHVERDHSVGRGLALHAGQLLAEAAPGVVLCPSTIPLAYLETDLPVAFWTDATFGGLLDYYPEYSGLSKRTVRDGHALEQAALARSDLCVYSSEWAARSAIERYGADPAKVRVLPYGANAPAPPVDVVEGAVRGRAQDVCNLLFVGGEWERKGGAIAVEAARSLIDRGVKAVLTVIGPGPEDTRSLPDFVRVMGYLHQGDQRARTVTRELLLNSHLLILPTRADCTPIAICEAFAFGLPVVTTDTGGVSSQVDSRAGALLPVDADGEAYAAAVLGIVGDRNEYATFAAAGRKAYDTRLNWHASCTQMLSLLHGIHSSRSAP